MDMGLLKSATRLRARPRSRRFLRAARRLLKAGARRDFMATATPALKERITDLEIDAGADAAPVRLAPPQTPKRRRTALVVALALVGAGAVGTYLFLQRGIEDTDDAQLDGDVVNVPARTSAVVTRINFTDNQTVHAGDLLAELDDAPARARLDQAAAELASAEAQAESATVQAQLTATNARGQRSAAVASLSSARAGVTVTAQMIAEADAARSAAQANFNKAQLDLTRANELIKAQAIPAAQVDAAQAAFDAAKAQVQQTDARAANLRSTTRQVEAQVSEANARYAQAATVPQQIADATARARMAQARVATARAARDQAALDFSYTKIYAPSDGVVSRRAINVGQMVTVGTPIVELVPTAHVWVTGNFKETQLRHLKPGQPATVKIDAYGLTLKGKVESFSAATGARFSLLPPDNATGNYTKIVQRLPVRIALNDVPPGMLLRPGLSVELAVNTRQ
jgi:membrane fusion protein (multidrug efflux system)